MPYRQLAYLPDRRSTRIEQSVHIIVRGLDASRIPYEEKACTLTISCHGCRYLSRNNVLRGDIATLEVVHLNNGRAAFSTQACVISVKQMGTEMLFEVAVELESPRNIWAVASPPDDWSGIPETARVLGSAQELHVVPRLEGPKALDLRGAPMETARPPFSSLKTGARSSLPPFLSQQAARLHQQIETLASETARAVIVKDYGQSLGEFGAELENETVKVFEYVVTVFADEMARRAQKLIETRAAQDMHEHWNKP